jgi:ribonuclease E
MEGAAGTSETEADAVVGAEGAAPVDGENAGDGGNRRRGRGRDRNRRERNEDGSGDAGGDATAAGLEGNAALTDAPGAGDAEAGAARAPRGERSERGERGERRERGDNASRADAPAADAVLAEDAEAVSARVATPFESRAFAPAPAPVAAPTPTPAPVAPAAVAAAPVVPAFDLPISDLNALAGAAGLEWVHSDAERVRSAQEAIANAPKAAHVPRERPAVAVFDEGPLVLVETRKDLNQLKLPFDANAPQRQS